MSTATLTRSETMPRVNLLPPEIGEAVKFRNAQAVMALAVVAVVGVVGALTFVARNDASSAQADLDAAQAQNATLTLEVAKYAQVPKTQAQLDAATAQLSEAMGQEIRYSFVLNDLSLTMPGGVWLTSVSAIQPVDTPGTAKGAWGTPAVATMVFAGRSSSLPQVAGWLDTLARQGAATDPYLNTAAATTDVPGYQFNSSVALTAKALSNRFAAKAGS